MAWQTIVVLLAVLVLHTQLLSAHPEEAKLENREDGAAGKTRVKRFAWQARNLILLITCVTRKAGWQYNGYGCWCGLGGGGQPVDGTDRCCKTHDKCYDRIIASGICGFPKNLSIYYTKYRKLGCRTCFPQRFQGPWWSRKKRQCKYQKCQCDMQMVKCFRRNLDTFSNRYKKYKKKKYC